MSSLLKGSVSETTEMPSCQKSLICIPNLFLLFKFLGMATPWFNYLGRRETHEDRCFTSILIPESHSFFNHTKVLFFTIPEKQRIPGSSKQRQRRLIGF